MSPPLNGAMSCPDVIFEVMRDLISGRFATGLLVGVPSSMPYHPVAGPRGNGHLLIIGAFLAMLKEPLWTTGWPFQKSTVIP